MENMNEKSKKDEFTRKRIDGQAVNGSRARLADVIPLNTPYTITIFPIYACNFKCNYCIHSLPASERDPLTSVISMDFDLYKKCINDMVSFNRKLKVLHFIGYGEPLLHSKIVDMIQYASDKQIAESIDIVTNGSLLTKDLSDRLIDSGLTTLRISLQGVSEIQYMERSKVHFDFQNFYENLRYFYQHRKNIRLHIKIIDIGLSAHEKEEFLLKFAPISDTIAIENLVSVVPKIDYEHIKKESDGFKCTVAGNEISQFEICPSPFFSMQINPDGKCVPCCNSKIPIYVGDAKEKTIVEIWNGETFKKFRKLQILKTKDLNSICKQCTQYKYSVFKEDILDYDAERLQKLF